MKDSLCVWWVEDCPTQLTLLGIGLVTRWLLDVAETYFFLQISCWLNWMWGDLDLADSISSTLLSDQNQVPSPQRPSCGRVVYGAKILGAVNFL